MFKLRKFLLLFLIIPVLSACKIDFYGDLYTSDLIKVSEEGSTLTFPMEVKFQVTSCTEGLGELNQTLKSYFLEYNFLNCKTSTDDFTDYVTSKVQVPVINDQETFKKSNQSLVGYLSKSFEDSSKVNVYLILNKSLFNNLSSYIENKTFQDLSLEESKFKLNLNNDLEETSVVVYPSFVDSKPIVFRTEYKMKKRENISIISANVNAAHLQLNSWTPIFYINK
tara:strand:- start:663 stop:1334 length:672 start_codon:yes stop_codon:yes gene_type:complete